MGSLEVKIDALNQRIKDHEGQRKWFLGLILTIVVATISAATLFFNVFWESQKTHRDLLQSYYQELRQVEKSATGSQKDPLHRPE
jgi:hypothetical protein